ncbi:unnamed protein product [Ectocarpus sp. 6 AP-2014]
MENQWSNRYRLYRITNTLKVTRRNAVLAVLTRCGRWERQHGDARKRAAVCLT